MKCICGIDSGFTGGITFLEKDTGNILSCDLPPIEEYFLADGKTKRRRLDIMAFLKLLNDFNPISVAIEKLNDRPNQGGMFNFGKMYGEYSAIIQTQGYKFVEIPPQTWKRALVGTFPKGTLVADKKKAAIEKAKELQPSFQFKDPSFVPTKRTKVAKDHDGLAESYLIAEYHRRCLIESL